MKMAYLATDPKTKRSYAICSADPDFIAGVEKDIRQWKKDGAIIELLPVEEAKARFCDCLSYAGSKQKRLF
jgi:hypothetical protein